MARSSLEELRTRRFWVDVMAELICTMLLVVVGMGSVMSCAKPLEDASINLISLNLALTVAVLVGSVAHISGGHLNPAVSIAFLASRKISIARFVFYTLGQCLGAVFGAAILKGLAWRSYNGTYGAVTLNGDMTPLQGCATELIITFVLVWTVYSAIDPRRAESVGSVPLAIGFSIGMCHFWAIRWTGASMNPARAFGPALISKTWDDHWIYWVGPLIGGIVAGLLYDFVFAVNATPAKLKGFFTLSYDDENYDKFGKKSSAANGGQEMS